MVSNATYIAQYLSRSPAPPVLFLDEDSDKGLITAIFTNVAQPLYHRFGSNPEERGSICLKIHVRKYQIMFAFFQERIRSAVKELQTTI